MNDKPMADWNTAIVLPLGVIAGQLVRIEAQLRSLNMTALRLAETDGRHHVVDADSHLEAIIDRLDCIGALVVDIQCDLRPTGASVGTRSTAPRVTPAPSGEREAGAAVAALAHQSRARPDVHRRDRDD